VYHFEAVLDDLSGSRLRTAGAAYQSQRHN
jgi:hypothetical protein